AGQLGLQRGTIQVFTDDPNQPVRTLTVVGTGLPDEGEGGHAGNAYVAVETPQVPGSQVTRLRSDPDGHFTFTLDQQAFVHVAAFDQASGLIAHDFDEVDAGDNGFDQVRALFEASVAPDSDGDGLPDDIEFAIGTSVNSRDTNNDGVDDFDSLLK